MIIKDSVWPAELTLSLLSGKWKSLALYHILCLETVRFKELERSLGTISSRILAKALKELELNGLVAKMIFPEIPPRTQYTATWRGRTLFPVLEALYQWGREHSDFYGIHHDSEFEEEFQYKAR